MFQKSQNSEYLDTIIERAKNKYLIWVVQFLDIVRENISLKRRQKLNDIGCNVGQFWKGLKRREFNIEFRGYDIEPQYIAIAKSILLLATSPPITSFSISSSKMYIFF